jgi:hypothetical protein
MYGTRKPAKLELPGGLDWGSGGENSWATGYRGQFPRGVHCLFDAFNLSVELVIETPYSPPSLTAISY